MRDVSIYLNYHTILKAPKLTLGKGFQMTNVGNASKRLIVCEKKALKKTTSRKSIL
jgi:hypothetical protein